MKIAVYVGKEEAGSESRVQEMLGRLEKSGVTFYRVDAGQTPESDTDMLMSIGGDGTFLTASLMVAQLAIPVVGVNLGRVGFLSENRPEDVADALLSEEYAIEERALLKSVLKGSELKESYSLNEVTVHRSGAAMLAVDVVIDGITLPTYWADGLIVSTSSGSTAYSLSVGGPIVLPQSKVLILAPIAPHNLNIRPLVIPDSSEIRMRMHSRDGKVVLTIDNRTVELPSEAEITVSLARFSLRRVRFNNSDFINALTEKLFWGEDVRNVK